MLPLKAPSHGTAKVFFDTLQKKTERKQTINAQSLFNEKLSDNREHFVVGLKKSNETKYKYNSYYSRN